MRVSTSDGRRCDFSANKLTIWISYMSFCNFYSKSDGRRYNFFFSFNYSSSLSTSESRAKIPPPDSFECFFDPQRSFGNPLRALFLKNRDFFLVLWNFPPNTREPLGCLPGFWPSWPKPCGGNNNNTQRSTKWRKQSRRRMNGSRKECMGSMWEERKALIRIEPGSELQKEVWKDVLGPWYIAPRNKLWEQVMRFHIDHTAESPLCRMCRSRGETVAHVVSECSKLAQIEHRDRHDNVARYIHWQLCGKCGLERASSLYEQKPEGVVESENFKILWDFKVQCDRKIDARRPDIVFIDKKERGSLDFTW